jgi:hypothetical protein
MCHIWEKGEVPTGFWWENLKETGHRSQRPNRRIIFKYVFKITGHGLD